MSFAVGIYGYTFTRRFAVAGGEIIPVYDAVRIAQAKAEDPNRYYLTGIMLIPISSPRDSDSWSSTFFDLEAALTLTEQRRVVLSEWWR